LEKWKQAGLMSANMSEPNAPGPSVPPSAKAPKKITNAQTVCNERNEKGKLCNGHLKQQNTGGEDARVHLRGDDVLFKCNLCGTYYMGPPLGHLRDPGKMNRFVERELTALLQAAGGTLPAFARSESGALVQVNPPIGQGHGAAPATAKPKPEAAPSAPVEETAEQKRERKLAEAAQRKASSAPIPGASGPPPAGETPEQKMARLKAVVEEAKRRKEAAGAAGDMAPAPPAAKPKPASRAAANLDSSSSADEHRSEAEAQAATGQASAVPMSPAAATASPAAAEKKAPPSKPPAGETPEQKIARLKAVVEEAKRRKEAGESPAPSASTAKPKPVIPAVQAEAPVETQSVSVAPEVEPEVVHAAPAVEKKAAPAAVPGPRPGETQEEKIARLKAVVAAAKAKKEGG
jgi:hypothetical protein